MCGVCGIFGHPEGRRIIALATDSIQHRGQSACGVAALDSSIRKITIVKDFGLVIDVLSDAKFLELEAKAYISHVRWPTQGDNSARNIQPHYTQALSGRLAIAINGDVLNMQEQVEFLKREGIRLYSTNDAEMVAGAIHWQIERRQRSIVEAIAKAMTHVRGAYAAVFLAEQEDAMFAFRDPYGIRPMLIGTLDGRFMVASETCQFDKVGANFMCEVKPGEIVRFDDLGMHRVQAVPAIDPKFRAGCSFEKLYFSRPDSKNYVEKDGELLDWSFYYIRTQLGRQLAIEHPAVDAQVVVPAPNSGIPAAIGYAQQAGIQYHPAIIAEGGRTFIEPNRDARKKKARDKYHIIEDQINGKSVVLVDDSSIKALTVQTLVAKLRGAGAREVHVRIASPKYLHPCHFGAETKAEWELSSRDKSEAELLRAVGNPDSYKFMSPEGFMKICEIYGEGNCYACFSGAYPVK